LWLIIIMALVALLIFLLICIPIDFILVFSTTEKPAFRIKFSWLMGLVIKDFKKNEIKTEKKNKLRRKSSRNISSRFIIKVFKTRGLSKQIILFFRNIFRQITVRELTADFKISFENPDDTALLYAAVIPISNLLNSYPRYRINVQPSFDLESIVAGNLYGNIRLIPIRFIKPVLLFLFSLPALRIASGLLRTKWGKSS
jgi:hypothetical protein